MLTRRTTLGAAAALATGALLPTTPATSAAPDTARIAALEAENATFATDNANLRIVVAALAEALRDLPDGDYPPFTECCRLLVRATPEECRAFAAETRRAASI